MIRYVLGFAFDDLGRVALIKKMHPEWQMNHWNGLGGKIEGEELPIRAMEREFFEEAGVGLTEWQHFGFIRTPNAEVWLYTVKHKTVRKVQSKSVEEVRLMTHDEWCHCNTIDNVEGLIALADIDSKSRPYVELTEVQRPG